MMQFKTFTDISTHLEALGMFHMDLSLSRMQQFATSGAGSAVVKISIVGTNGKGSTAVFLERMAREHGLTTGLYSSPHFLDVRERIRINGEKLPQEEWVRIANDLEVQVPDLGLTYFEWLTCLSVLAFDDTGVDLAVMEAGLGGRYDATRVFEPELTLLTPVGMDHEKVLGHTLAEIAADKSRAISVGGLAITAAQHPEVMHIYEQRAKAVGATLEVAAPVKDIPLGLAGAYQRENAGLALAGFQAFCTQTGRVPIQEACDRGLALAWLPGRFQVAVGEPTIILDGAHNAHGLHALARSLNDKGLVPDAVIFACMKDKNVAEMRSALLELTQGTVYLPVLDGHERILPAAELAGLLGERAVVAASVGDGVERAGRGAKTVLICGSLYLLAEFYKLHPHLLEQA